MFSASATRVFQPVEFRTGCWRLVEAWMATWPEPGRVDGRAAPERIAGRSRQTGFRRPPSGGKAARRQRRAPKSALTLVQLALACWTRRSDAGSDCRGRPAPSTLAAGSGYAATWPAFKQLRHGPARSEGPLVRCVAELAAYLRVRTPVLTRAQRARACRQMLPIAPWGESMSEFFAPEWMRIRSR